MGCLQGLAAGVNYLRLPSGFGYPPGLGSGVRHANSDAEDFHGKLVHIDTVQVAEHHYARMAAGNNVESRAGSLLAASVGQNVQAKLVQDAPTEAVARFFSVRRL